MVDAFAFVADNISVTAMVRDRGINVVNLSRKSANYKFTRMKKPFVIP